MAKITGPLLSLGGGGSIAKSVVFSKWKGRPYARQHVVPANPNTTGQQTTRTSFSFGNALWKTAPTEFSAPWDLFATGQVLTGRNAFLSSFVKATRGDSNLQAMIFTGGAKGGIAPTAAALTGGSGTIDSAMTAPALPSGWAITKAVVAACVDADPTSDPAPIIYAATDDSDPYAPQITGLDAGDYVVGSWFEYTKADGSTAYGASINDTVTVS